MRLFKRISAAVLAGVLCFGGITAQAYEIPHGYWSLNDGYSSALNTEDYSKIAQYGSGIINLMSKEPSNDTTDNIIGSRAYETAFAYYFLGDYDEAAKYFNLYIPYGEKLGWTDGVRIAEEFAKQLPSDLKVYKHTDENQKYYGAKNEPKGILSGQVSEKSKEGESAVLLYLEYGYTDEIDWARVVMENAYRDGKAVELAINFPNQGETAREISESDLYLQFLDQLLEEFRDVPVFCRIGAEVNIWQNICTPEEFKRAFCIIADRVRAHSNTAIVWSIAHTDPWKSDDRPYTADDYYPGDDLVDYAGITVYSNKYFEGREWHGKEKFNEVCFKTGYNADPVLMIKDFVEKYGDRKPIMISECGGAYYTGGEINQNHIDWGAEKIREIYSYIPMVYPQVKLMAYFNKKMSSETNWYDLDSAYQMAEAYSDMNSQGWFVKGDNTKSADVFFEEVEEYISADSEKVTLSAYPHVYGADTVKVVYYADDEFVTSSESAPYTAEISLNGVSTIKVDAEGSNGHIVTKVFKVSDGEISDEDDSLFNDIDRLAPEQSENLKKVYDMGIVGGYSDGSFRPFNTITRGEFATMVCRMMGYSPDGRCEFDDAKDHWATGYIKACVEAGAINGVGDNLFAPEDNVTIEQALKIVTILSNMAEPNAKYPDGFVEAAESFGLTDNMIESDTTAELYRIDAATIMANAL